MARHKPISKRYILIFFLLFLILVTLLIAFIYLSPIESKVFEVEFIVNNSIGVEANGSALVYGIVIPGSESTKRIFIQNNHDFPVVVKTYPSKSVEDFLLVDRRIVLQSRGNYSLPVNLILSENASFGNYQGELKILIYK